MKNTNGSAENRSGFVKNTDFKRNQRGRSKSLPKDECPGLFIKQIIEIIKNIF